MKATGIVRRIDFYVIIGQGRKSLKTLGFRWFCPTSRTKKTDFKTCGALPREGRRIAAYKFIWKERPFTHKEKLDALLFLPRLCTALSRTKTGLFLFSRYWRNQKCLPMVSAEHLNCSWRKSQMQITMTAEVTGYVPSAGHAVFIVHTGFINPAFSESVPTLPAQKQLSSRSSEQYHALPERRCSRWQYSE